MKDEYLWNKTGAADEEVEHLEQLLGRLRHEPQTLRLPTPIQHRRLRKFPNRVTQYAIAAAALVLLTIAGLWFAASSRNDSKINIADVITNQAQETSLANPRIEKFDYTAQKSEDFPPPIAAVTPEFKKPESQNFKTKRSVKPNLNVREKAILASAKNKSDPKNKLEAKEQLLLALRLTSEKLNFVRIRTRTTDVIQVSPTATPALKKSDVNPAR